LAGQQVGGAFPFVPGYCSVGRVIGRGSDVSIEVGTLVNTGGSVDTGEYNRTWGAHMSHAICAAADALVLPAELDPLEAVAVKLAAIPYHGVRLAKPLPEHKVAVIGLGVIGHLAAKLYSLSGAHTVGCDRSLLRVEQAMAGGIAAVHVDTSPRAALARHFPYGADIVVDCTGVPAVLPAALEVCRDLPWGDHGLTGARFVVQGSYAESFTIPYEAAFCREVAFLVPRSDAGIDKRTVVELMRRKVLSLSSVISDVRSPDQAQSAYDDLKDPTTRLMSVAFRW
jgi:2-desacetyl-2-hydroxyethyl bacteriochlorophyllide A dehydrogenase